MTKMRLGGSEKQGQGMADLREQFVGFDQDAAVLVPGPWDRIHDSVRWP